MTKLDSSKRFGLAGKVSAVTAGEVETLTLAWTKDGESSRDILRYVPDVRVNWLSVSRFDGWAWKISTGPSYGAITPEERMSPNGQTGSALVRRYRNRQADCTVTTVTVQAVGSERGETIRVDIAKGNDPESESLVQNVRRIVEPGREVEGTR